MKKLQIKKKKIIFYHAHKKKLSHTITKWIIIVPVTTPTNIELASTKIKWLPFSPVKSEHLQSNINYKNLITTFDEHAFFSKMP